ncbi:hypothetical protein BC939DRAFT_441680 [Gamsiella multidivaricata]|uniref:uncharacterized protein n=1 Tax=Gamsiella multidivaricata TaxID=101098 RepID=UPI00221E8782|nr:uncharacterized protein BC939DRAFT_441680 [Gamsiella multidivaricata]KAG0369730.1 hypothetical protein BGZ54_009077 [Gamsiella multidivaricata]KAI7829367.1 hypothetical protein BC939DRAFT_441680 [Gamsiella multidivaricata]
MDTVQQELFGGAITMDLPRKFENISHVREVPDHQEVFVNVDEDQSVIVEILELAAEASNEACAAFHYQQLAEDNDAEDASVIQSVSILNNAELPTWPAEAKIYLLLGQQRIAKFNERQRQQEAQAQAQAGSSSADARNLVQIMMLVVRLPRQGTDLVISYNVPLQISESSSSKQVAHEGSIQEAEVWFRTLVGTFQVRDWGLFGN